MSNRPQHLTALGLNVFFPDNVFYIDSETYHKPLVNSLIEFTKENNMELPEKKEIQFLKEHSKDLPYCHFSENILWQDITLEFLILAYKERKTDVCEVFERGCLEYAVLTQIGETGYLKNAYLREGFNVANDFFEYDFVGGIYALFKHGFLKNNSSTYENLFDFLEKTRKHNDLDKIENLFITMENFLTSFNHI